MKFNTTIPRDIKFHYLKELEQYREAFKKGNLIHAWYHLERAHVIGQSYPIEHSRAHWLMLKFGFAVKDWKEILGQIPRLLVGGVKSFVGQIPTGNTGGANVPPLKPMPIPPDIQEILKK
ncbi:Protein of unknown function [Salinimicrobium catena]|uniref:DUF3703 domain-containing protein n=1 Tax=Salinimicrobium catena TaxID=390640 RepID=A0A1H5MXW5_9FLAO|nr:DUF3703 domain-containing protein [Salinimicrobium catena]SDL32264.1 Protein of unknown function [Salinimicrobium catena]SEE94202.1 Protein of unknown function [Salinimicrobium catena]